MLILQGKIEKINQLTMKLRILFILLVTFFVSCFAEKPAYIIDTDMGFDDWLAVLYVLSDRDIQLKAVTVDCQGETFCPVGAHNAEKLMWLSHHAVPVYFGHVRFSRYDFPLSIRQFASDMMVPGFNNLSEDKTMSDTPAAVAIAKIMEKAASQHQTVSIISIGTATNIADAYLFAKKQGKAVLFSHGLKMIYKGGGAFGKIIHGKISNEAIPGNIAIPNMVQTKNTTAEWNIYANAQSMQTILSAHLPVTFVPLNATNVIPMNWATYDQFKKMAATSDVKKFSENAMYSTYALQKTWKGLYFWDTAVTLAAIYPDIVSKQYHASVWVDLRKSKYYGTTFCAHHNNNTSTVFYQIDANRFYQRFFLRG